MTENRNTPGSWIFDRNILSWLKQDKLFKQLPGPYQDFAADCLQYFANNTDDNIEDGSERFQALVQSCQTLDIPKELCIQTEKFQIFVNLEDPRFFQVINELTGGAKDPELLKVLLKPGDSFFDIGANHGSFSLMAAQVLGSEGNMLAVEAQPRLANLVRQSFAANLTCNFEVHQLALGDRHGEVEFMIPVDTSGSAGIFAGHSGTHKFQKLTVQLKPFDDLIDISKFKPNGLMKLDIEGSEYAFLKGAKKAITQLQPTIFMEINPNTLKASDVDLEEIKTLLSEYGYQTYAELGALQEKIELSALREEPQRNIVIFPAGSN